MPQIYLATELYDGIVARGGDPRVVVASLVREALSKNDVDRAFAALRDDPKVQTFLLTLAALKHNPQRKQRKP
jgi:hypothetical protein